jgi:hypothetical protein
MAFTRSPVRSRSGPPSFARPSGELRMASQRATFHQRRMSTIAAPASARPRRWTVLNPTTPSDGKPSFALDRMRRSPTVSELVHRLAKGVHHRGPSVSSGRDGGPASLNTPSRRLSHSRSPSGGRRICGLRIDIGWPNVHSSTAPLRILVEFPRIATCTWRAYVTAEALRLRPPESC